jgi:glycopeptide antibiotics resistance protein
MGIWGLHDSEGQLYTQNIENVVLFIPLLYLWLLINKKKNEGKKRISVLAHGVCTAICITLSIEFLQVFLRVGTIQITDILFNILGGTLGTILFLLVGNRKK